MHIETVDLRRTAISHGGKRVECGWTAHCYGYNPGSWIRICGRTRSENFWICVPHMVGRCSDSLPSAGSVRSPLPPTAPPAHSEDKSVFTLSSLVAAKCLHNYTIRLQCCVLFSVWLLLCTSVIFKNRIRDKRKRTFSSIIEYSIIV